MFPWVVGERSNERVHTRWGEGAGGTSFWCRLFGAGSVGPSASGVDDRSFPVTMCEPAENIHFFVLSSILIGRRVHSRAFCCRYLYQHATRDWLISMH